MRTFNHTETRQFLKHVGASPYSVLVLVKGTKSSRPYALRLLPPKPQHLQYSKAVAILCDATEDYGSFVGGVFAKEKYDKAISAVRNLQAQYMAI